MNCGDEAAASIRTALAEDLADWAGGIAVIDGDLSSQLRQRAYRDFGLSLESALQRAAEHGLTAIRIRGCSMEEFDQTRAAIVLADNLALAAGGWTVEITGAWYEPGGGDGCVNSVVEALETVGVSVTVRPSAAVLDPEDAPMDEMSSRSTPCA